MGVVEDPADGAEVYVVYTVVGSLMFFLGGGAADADELELAAMLDVVVDHVVDAVKKATEDAVVSNHARMLLAIDTLVVGGFMQYTDKALAKRIAKLAS